MIANCLRISGVPPYDSRDALLRPRFHHGSPMARYTRSQDSPEGFTVGLDSRWLSEFSAISRYKIILLIYSKSDF
jgi:hypothetical protein